MDETMKQSWNKVEETMKQSKTNETQLRKWRNDEINLNDEMNEAEQNNEAQKQRKMRGRYR
jgi:hypothetical protein